MKVKIDTKEKFHVITIGEPKITANMTAELQNSLSAYLQNGVKNIILNLSNVESLDLVAAEMLIKVQQSFYEQNASFVVCNLQPAVEEFLDKEQLLETLSATPTESEAWDIVQMEEIERELLDDAEPGFN
ncbi:STAS domain-containing protein [Flavihumibacter profundi]|uniref:STAS domain-containing protein n=1 Tax=Flavihumibacter profundi TaxID=2716883 RepID=UPI001CC537F0|nr:STAS domain-containing protein [Flavihumibacter profundi]MBZ5855639.1 STAS domain-containing protein [Flavihumibacter profundi]